MQLLQENRSVEKRKQSLFSTMGSSRSKSLQQTTIAFYVYSRYSVKQLTHSVVYPRHNASTRFPLHFSIIFITNLEPLAGTVRILCHMTESGFRVCASFQA